MSGKKYTIQNGDTLGQIAKNAGTTVDNLVKINNIADPNKIYAGQTLQLDSGNAATKVLYDDASPSNNSGNAPTSSNSNTPTASEGKAPSASEGFTYDDYVESDTVSQAFAALEQHMAAKPGEYKSTWEGQINDLIDRIMNREDFSYDVNEDALYQQLKDQYTALGKMAMQDTMGQAAAMTGGYGSSYASTAGNQAYQAYLSQLNEMVPELYGMARDQYNQEGQEMYTQYGMLADQESQDYGRWVDGYNQWASERDHLEGTYKDERSFDYGKYADDKGYAYDDYRNAIADQQWEQTHELNVNADNRAQEAWELEQKAYADSTKSYAGTTSNGTEFNNGSLTDGQVKELQAALGVDADGKYGPKSKEAAKGLSAEEAYAKYVGSTAGEVVLKDMSPEERVEVYDTLDNFVNVGEGEEPNLFAAENYIDYLYMHEYIDEEDWKALRNHYLPGLVGQTDTTVKPTTIFGSGAGGGKYGTPMVKE